MELLIFDAVQVAMAECVKFLYMLCTGGLRAVNGTGDRDYLLWGNRKGYSDDQVLRSVSPELDSFLK